MEVCMKKVRMKVPYTQRFLVHELVSKKQFKRDFRDLVGRELFLNFDTFNYSNLLGKLKAVKFGYWNIKLYFIVDFNKWNRIKGLKKLYTISYCVIVDGYKNIRTPVSLGLISKIYLRREYEKKKV